MAYLVNNGGISTLAAAITTVTQTAITVAAGHGARFPAPAGGDYTLITLENAAGAIEIVSIVARATDVLTVGVEGSTAADAAGRGREGTTAALWAAADIVEGRATAAIVARGGNARTTAELKAAGGAALIGNSPAGNIAATTVQAALNELDVEKALLAGAGTQAFAASTFTGALTGDVTGNVSGSAATLLTARLFNGRTFNGSASVNDPGSPMFVAATVQAVHQAQTDPDLNLCIQAGDFAFLTGSTNKPAGITAAGYLHVSRNTDSASGAVHVHQLAMDMNGTNVAAVFARRGVPVADTFTATWSAWYRLVGETGAGATGTWPISITGTAATVTRQVLHVRDEKTSGTAGGASVAGSQTRTLNTVVQNTITDATLGSDDITLPAGTYRITASAPSHQSGRSRIRLFNVTDAAVVLLGTSEMNGTGVTTRATLIGVFTITAAKAMRIVHHIAVATAGNGLGVETSDTFVEIYCEVYITKIG